MNLPFESRHGAFFGAGFGASAFGGVAFGAAAVGHLMNLPLASLQGLASTAPGMAISESAANASANLFIANPFQ